MSNSLLLLALLFFLSACLLNYANCVDLKLTAENEIELDGLFKRYNKPALQEIKTIHGDLYSCVDFYKQPAFDHPLLKNHSYHPELHGRPSNLSQGSSLFKGLWVNGNGCPMGTIPIRKFTKDQFIRTHKSFQKLYPTDEPIPNRYRSCVHTLDGSQKFFGGSASLNFYNYPVDKTQYTAGYQIIRAGNDQFQFGWMINPEVYGDGQTRLFLSTKVENIKCLNLLCGGFVQTNKDIPLGAAITPATERGAKQAVEITPLMIRESNIWKLYGVDGEGGRLPIGYWPNEVLKGLAGPAEYLEWGGEAYNPNDLKGPGMGSGYFPEGDVKLDGYARQIIGFEESGTSFDLRTKDTELYSDNNDYYKVEDGGYIDSTDAHTVFYGGPGRQD